MELSVHTFVSLDGVMQAPSGVQEDPSNGFERGGWLVPHSDADQLDPVDGWFRQADAGAFRHDGREPLVSEGAVMAGLSSKSFDAPDETRTPDKTKVDVVRLAGATAARFTFSRAGGGRSV